MKIGARDIKGEHTAILTAIMNRDARGATNALVEHLGTTARLAAGGSLIEPASKKGKRRVAPAATV
jgi:DNA-binding GntR family transcriptional regulator